MSFSQSLQNEIQEKNFSPASKTCNTTTAAGCVMTKWMTKSKKYTYIFFRIQFFLRISNKFLIAAYDIVSISSGVLLLLPCKILLLFCVCLLLLLLFLLLDDCGVIHLALEKPVV